MGEIRRRKGQRKRESDRWGPSSSNNRNWSYGKPPRFPDDMHWEQKFCQMNGVSWEKLLETKQFLPQYSDITGWNDSAGKEAYDSAKARYWAQINGLQPETPLPDPNALIDTVDHDAPPSNLKLYQNLHGSLSEDEGNDSTDDWSSDEWGDGGVILWDSHYAKEEEEVWGDISTGWGENQPIIPTGWGDIPIQPSVQPDAWGVIPPMQPSVQPDAWGVIPPMQPSVQPDAWGVIPPMQPSVQPDAWGVIPPMQPSVQPDAWGVIPPMQPSVQPDAWGVIPPMQPSVQPDAWGVIPPMQPSVQPDAWGVIPPMQPSVQPDAWGVIQASWMNNFVNPTSWEDMAADGNPGTTYEGIIPTGWGAVEVEEGPRESWNGGVVDASYRKNWGNNGNYYQKKGNRTGPGRSGGARTGNRNYSKARQWRKKEDSSRHFCAPLNHSSQSNNDWHVPRSVA